MILRSLLLSGGLVAGLVPLAAEAQVRPYLSWPGKVASASPRLEKALPNPVTGAPGFDIPPSPYGEVGSPYAPPATPAPVRVPALPMPEPVAVPPKPIRVETPPEVVVAPVAVPVVAPVAEPEDQPFVLPAGSKYATRTQVPQTQVPQTQAPQTQAPQTLVPAPTEKTGTATAPALSEPLSVPENEPVFVPGMRVSDPATQAPRFYSLHRAYGYQPDPVDTPASELKIDPSQVETKE